MKVSIINCNYDICNKYFIFVVSGSLRNKILKFLIFYSKHFCVYKLSDNYWLSRRCLFGNKNIHNSNEEFFKNIESNCKKLILMEPNDYILSILKLKTKTNNFIDLKQTLIEMIKNLYVKKHHEYNISYLVYWLKDFDIINPHKEILFNDKYSSGADIKYILEEYR